MFRRVFWFVAGAVTGIAGVSWVKRRATEMREAITLESVARLIRDSLVSAFRWARDAVVTFGLSPDRNINGGSPSGATVTERPPRRHIASRAHNSHR